MKKLWSILLVLFTLSLCACSEQAPAATDDPQLPQTTLSDSVANALYPAKITDLLGRKLTVENQPEKVVSLCASNTEILFALGLGDKVVGVDAFSDTPEQVSALPKVGDFNGPNIEAIAGLSPDIVFAAGGIQKESIDQLEALGIVVISSEAQSMADIYYSVELIASTMGVEDRLVTDAMRTKQDALTSDLAMDDPARKSIYFAVSFGDMGDYSAGPNTFINSIIELAGGRNVMAEAPVAWPSYTLEEIVKTDPDIIFISGDDSMVDLMKTSSGYKDMRAVKEGHVYAIDPNLTSRPSPSILDALKIIKDVLDK